MLTVAKKVIKFTNKLLLIIQTIDCNTETNDDFCVDENKDDLYIFFKKHCVIASNNARFFLLQVYVKEVDRMVFLFTSAFTLNFLLCL